METIFSPVFDRNDSQFKPINHNNAGLEDYYEEEPQQGEYFFQDPPVQQ